MPVTFSGVNYGMTPTWESRPAEADDALKLLMHWLAHAH